MNTSHVLLVYGIYLPTTILLTIYTAKVLFKSGEIFMLDIFKGRESIARATNQLFKMGFYLLNLGFALMMLESNAYITNSQEMLEVTSLKVGSFSIYLGVMLFLNMYLFFRGKKKSKEMNVTPAA